MKLKHRDHIWKYCVDTVLKEKSTDMSTLKIRRLKKKFLMTFVIHQRIGSRLILLTGCHLTVFTTYKSSHSLHQTQLGIHTTRSSLTASSSWAANCEQHNKNEFISSPTLQKESQNRITFNFRAHLYIHLFLNLFNCIWKIFWFCVISADSTLGGKKPCFKCYPSKPS